MDESGHSNGTGIVIGYLGSLPDFRCDVPSVDRAECVDQDCARDTRGSRRLPPQFALRAEPVQMGAVSPVGSRVVASACDLDRERAVDFNEHSGQGRQ